METPLSICTGVDVAPNFQSKAKKSRQEFYKCIWPLVAECVWEAKDGRKAEDDDSVHQRYRYKKAQRIISGSDLEPIAYLLRAGVEDLGEGLTLKGAPNQLCSLMGWGKTALTTRATAVHQESGTVLHTQSVFGGKHISDKTREVAARMRTNLLACNDDGEFEASGAGSRHLLVVDGDWPLKSKLNLMEAGFSGVFEIGELDSLTKTLEALSN